MTDDRQRATDDRLITRYTSRWMMDDGRNTHDAGRMTMDDIRITRYEHRYTTYAILITHDETGRINMFSCKFFVKLPRKRNFLAFMVNMLRVLILYGEYYVY